MKKDLYKKGLVVGMMLLFIGVATTPVIGVHLAKNNLIIDKSVNNISVGIHDIHPEYYDVTIWKIHPTWYEEEIKRVSYEEAMEIKAAYEQIESDTDDLIEQAKQKNAVLRSYGVLSSDDTSENYEKEFNEWKKTQGMPKLWRLINGFRQKSQNNWPWGEIAMALFGFLLGYFHGPLEGQQFGMPFPFTIVVEHKTYGHGPAEAIATTVFGFPLPFTCYFNEPTSTDVFVDMVAGIGYIGYLPFILNKNSKGQFEVFVFAAYAVMSTPLEGSGNNFQLNTVTHSTSQSSSQ